MFVRRKLQPKWKETLEHNNTVAIDDNNTIHFVFK